MKAKDSSIRYWSNQMQQVQTNFATWITSGDEWIISYLSVPFGLPMIRVTTFSISQALEHYFKACIVKKYGYGREVFKFGHDTFGMFEDLKNDPNFLPEININRGYFDKYSIEKEFDSLSEELQMEILKYDYLLLPFKYNADLKYPRFKKANGQTGFAFTNLDERYAKIFQHIRCYLEWDSQKYLDILKLAIEYNTFRESYGQLNFLNECIRGTK